MRIITRRPLKEFWLRYPKAYEPLDSWYRTVKKSKWKSLDDFRKVFGRKVDQVGKFTVFDIGGNKFRLIVVIHYNRKRLYVRHVLTHSEYSLGKWKYE